MLLRRTGLWLGVFCGVLSANSANAIMIAAAEMASEGDTDTPVVADPIERPPVVAADQKWVAPDYSGQSSALGYSDGAFQIPAGMESRVQFWEEIYTKYTSDQGVLHDSRYINLVYETIDFADITQNPNLEPRQKEKQRRERVKLAKKNIEERLRNLQAVKDASALQGEDLRYWKLFEGIGDKDKFLEASRRGRLRFQLGQRDRFIEGIYQSGRHLKEMEEIFRREGMPIELTRLPFVESSFNLKARSKVGASGIWQFMRSTARMYMRMDSSADERNDPLRATVAAARKLRNNYQMLQSWPLAVTGYNHGPSGVQRLVKKFNTTNLAELTDVRKGRFGFASANFYASFLAALRVEQNADKHFGPLLRMAELRGTEIKLERPISVQQLVEWFDNDLVAAQNFNPHIRPHLWPRGSIQAKNFVRVRNSKAEVVRNDLSNGKRLASVSSAPDSEMQESSYVIQEGETLGEIATRYRVRIDALMDINGISDARRVRAGTTIQIPARSASSR